MFHLANRLAVTASGLAWGMVRRRPLPITGAVIVVALAAAACGGVDAPPARDAPGRLQVVATTAVLADLARNVGGDTVEVRSLVRPGADIHSYQSTPGDSVAIHEARVIVTNGGGLDDALQPVIDAARRSDATVVAVAEEIRAGRIAVTSLTMGDGNPGDGGPVAQPADDDPHLWLDPTFAIGYVALIRDAMIKADPDHAEQYRTNADAYIQELTKLDAEVEEMLRAVPPHRRRLVTFHDAYGFFGQRYGFAVSALAGSQAGDVTSGAVGAIVDRIRNEGIPAVFAEPQFNQDVLRQVARDTGAAVGIIYSDVLIDEAPTYLDMMRANARNIAALLGGDEGR